MIYLFAKAEPTTLPEAIVAAAGLLVIAWIVGKWLKYMKG